MYFLLFEYVLLMAEEISWHSPLVKCMTEILRSQ